MNALNYLISVIIPVYNVEEYLDKCILSIQKQTYKNLDIILVDDGSTDACPVICDRYAKEDQRIQVIHKANGGLSDARNCGLKYAKGEYIGFVDSDDWIEPEMYSYLLNNTIQYNADISCCEIRNIYKNCVLSSEEKGEVRLLNREEAIKSIVGNSSFCLKNAACNKLYKKSVIKDLKFPQGKEYEDVVFSIQAVHNCKNIVYSDLHLYNYVRERSNSIMNKPVNISSVMCRVEQYENRQKFLENNKYYNLLQKANENFLTILYICRSQVKDIEKDKKNYCVINKKIKKIRKELLISECSKKIRILIILDSCNSNLCDRLIKIYLAGNKL